MSSRTGLRGGVVRPAAALADGEDSRLEIANSLRGDDGNDTLSGEGGDDILGGGNGNDRLFGANGSDRLFGGNGQDMLMGVEPSSVAPGAGEIDTLTGDEGVDTFVLGQSNAPFYLDPGIDGLEGYALIADFQTGSDRLQLAGRQSDYFFLGNSFLFFDEGSVSGTFDSGDDLLAFLPSGFNPATDLTFV